MSFTSRGREKSDEEEEGFSPTPQQLAAQQRLQQIQRQVDEVVGIMRTNVEKVLERDRKLSELDDQTRNVQKGASQFEHVAGGLSNDKSWSKILQVVIVLLIILLIIIMLILADYYISKWLLINKCLEGILGFRWCYNGTFTTSSSKTTSSATPLLIVNPVNFTATTEWTSVTEAPTPPPAESVIATILASTTITAVSKFAATSSTPQIIEVPMTQTAVLSEDLTILPTFPSSTPKLVAETVLVTLAKEVVTTESPQPVTLPPITIPEIITSNVMTFTNPPKMLKRQHDVLDPAVEVEAVLNAEGDQMYGLHDVPLYKNVDESEPFVTVLS